MDSQGEDEAEAENGPSAESGPVLVTPKPQEPSNEGREEYEPHSLSFSGLEQDPEAYLRWERGLDDWFWYYKIPKEKRLCYAINALIGEAYTWWVQEEALSYYHNPITTWGSLKQHMYREFVQKSHNNNYIPKKLMMKTTSRVWTPTPKEDIVLVQPPTKNKSNEQGKSPDSLKIAEPNLPCVFVETFIVEGTHHKNGDDNVDNKLDRIMTQENGGDSTDQKQNSQDQGILGDDPLLILRATRKESTHEFNPEPYNKWKPKEEQEIFQVRSIPQVSTPLKPLEYTLSKAILVRLFSAKSVGLSPTTNKKNENQREAFVLIERPKSIPMTKVNSYWDQFIIIDPKTVIMHFLCSMDNEKGLGIRGVHKDRGVEDSMNSNIRNQHQSKTGPDLLKPSTKKAQHVTKTKSIKENPPDPPLQRESIYQHLQAPTDPPRRLIRGWTPAILIRARDDESIYDWMAVKRLIEASQFREARPNSPSFKVLECINDNAYKIDLPGKFQVSNTFNITYLESFDAGPTVLRTKPSQEGGNDEDISYGPAEPSRTDQRNKAPFASTKPATRSAARSLYQRFSGVIRSIMEQLENLYHTEESVCQALKPLGHIPSDKGILTTQSNLHHKDQYQSSVHLSNLEEDTQTRSEPEDEGQATSYQSTSLYGLNNAKEGHPEIQYFKHLENLTNFLDHLSNLEEDTQTRPEPGDQVQATTDLTIDRTSLYNAEKDQLAATLGQLSLSFVPAINDHPEFLRRIKSTYNQEETSQNAIFWVKTLFGRFSTKPGPLRKVHLCCITTWYPP